MITQQELKELFRYDPNTGLFVRVVNRCKGRIGDIAGSIDSKGYVVIHIGSKIYKAHRLAFLYMTGKLPEKDTDHINLDRLDNRWCNLREASRGQNVLNRNKCKNNKLGIKGVHKIGNKYKAQAKFKGKVIYLGRFDTKEEAGAAYLKFSKENHGEFYRRSV